MPTIFDITADMQALDDLLTEVGGDVTDPEAASAIDKWFTELDDQIETKVENYCRLIAELESRSAARKGEADRMYARSKVDANAAKGLRTRMVVALAGSGIRKLETETYRISVANHGGKLPMEIDDDGVPTDYLTRQEVVSVDKDAIRAALENGMNLPFARFLERGQRLSIR